MNTVQPIKDHGVIKNLKGILREESYRNYILFVMGINVGIRIGDLLPSRVCDVAGKYIILTEEKTGKEKMFAINAQLRLELDAYISEMELGPDDFLFPGKTPRKSLSRQQAYNIISSAAIKAGEKKVGTHSLRKTFGYFHYQRYKDVALLQRIFNHSSPSVTLRYIGIDQDEMDASTQDFFL